jgi:hypothetical protein
MNPSEDLRAMTDAQLQVVELQRQNDAKSYQRLAAACQSKADACRKEAKRRKREAKKGDAA